MKKLDFEIYNLIAREGKTFQASQSELAALFSVSRRTLQRSLARLKAANILQVIKKNNNGGQYMQNIYLVNHAPKMPSYIYKYNKIIKTKTKTLIKRVLVKNNNIKQVVIKHDHKEAYSQRMSAANELPLVISILTNTKDPPLGKSPPFLYKIMPFLPLKVT